MIRIGCTRFRSLRFPSLAAWEEVPETNRFRFAVQSNVTLETSWRFNKESLIVVNEKWPLERLHTMGPNDTLMWLVTGSDVTILRFWFPHEGRGMASCNVKIQQHQNTKRLKNVSTKRRQRQNEEGKHLTRNRPIRDQSREPDELKWMHLS